MLCKLLVFCAWLTIVSIRIDRNATTWSEDSGDLDILWLHELDEVFHDNVHTVFVEIAMITEAKKIEFETL
jgi:hypothetical protein